MAKNKNQKRKATPIVKSKPNEWIDETIEESASDGEEEVCFVYLI